MSVCRPVLYAADKKVESVAVFVLLIKLLNVFLYDYRVGALWGITW